MESSDFLPDLIAEKAKKEGKTFKFRDDIKPLHVTQPEGVSFKMNGNEIEWQKWKLHICECYRGREPFFRFYSDMCLLSSV